MEFFLLEFFFGKSPDLRVVGLVMFDEMPEDAGELDSLAVAQSVLRTCSLRSHFFRGSTAPVWARVVMGVWWRQLFWRVAVRCLMVSK